MEEDEDTYGFGSFSDLFDAGTTQTTKRLDLSALSRYCMSERLFSRFQHQRQDKCCVLFQHVAAKFNGVSIDGGLGELGMPGIEGGGFVWLQTAQSDSDALERREKELQDITSRETNEHKSAAALFVDIKRVANVHPTTVQNTVQGVEVKLTEGNKLEFTFMPGPFANPTYRDEFIQRLQKQMSADKETNQAVNETERTSSRSSDAMSELKRKTPDLKSRERNTACAKKEEFRQLVRKYTMLDQTSDEAIAIAKQMFAGTGYQLGPMTKDVPKFSADSEYRKKTVEKLTDFLKRMNQEWSEADKHRELHTKTKHSRNEDDLFEYTDTVTGVRIPTRTYEQRYLEYVKAHDIDPVLHIFPVQNEAAKEGQSEQNGTAQSTAPAENDTGAYFMETLGIDIRSSCIIDKDFFSSVSTSAPPGSSVYQTEDKVFRAAVDKARGELWNSWGSWFARESGGLDHAKTRTQSASSISATLKRSKDRRRSLVLPNSEDLQSTVEANLDRKSQDTNGSTSSVGESRQSRTKRSRSSAHDVQESRRKTRRQSITGVVDLPSVVSTKADGKLTEKCKTPQHSRISPRPRRETSSLEMVGDEDSNLCQLCYNDQALVHMKPCNHTVCQSCWSRLSPSSRKNGTASGRVCPWDREQFALSSGSFGLEKQVKWSEGNTREVGPTSHYQPHKPVTTKQASATVARLLQWKKRNDANREVKAQLAEDERIEEEEQFLSSIKRLPLGQVQAAALRNYQAASRLHWKKLVLQSLAEQQQRDEEEAECTFRPRLIAQPRRFSPSTCQAEKKCRSSCAAVDNATRNCLGLQQSSKRLVDGGVFERLYKPQTDALEATTVYTPDSTVKRTSSRVVAAFVARQERDQEDRQRRLKQAAHERYMYSHMPKLSKHSRDICAALREGGADQVGHYRRKQKPSTISLSKHPLYTIPACAGAQSKQSEFARSPFTSIVQALRQQEKTMRTICKSN